MTQIPYGYCQCGCGQKTKLASETHLSKGITKGKPNRYIFGHNRKYDQEKQDKLFWSKVAITADDNQCWLWKGGKSSSGYGNVGRRGRQERAHRVAWSYPNYIIPEGMFVCHSCDNPACCNPKHLFLGTHQDNVNDMWAKGRGNIIKGDKHYSAVLTPEQIEAIRYDYAYCNKTYKQIAKEFNVSIGSIFMVVNRRGRFAITYGGLKRK